MLSSVTLHSHFLIVLMVEWWSSAICQSLTRRGSNPAGLCSKSLGMNNNNFHPRLWWTSLARTASFMDVAEWVSEERRSRLPHDCFLLENVDFKPFESGNSDAARISTLTVLGSLTSTSGSVGGTCILSTLTADVFSGLPMEDSQASENLTAWTDCGVPSLSAVPATLGR